MACRYCIYKGDVVLHKGRRCVVSEVLNEGRNRPVFVDGRRQMPVKAFVAGNPIDELTGKVLTRTRVAIGADWEAV
jgi:hypothetical protein